MTTNRINLGFQGVCRFFPLDSDMDRELFKCGNGYLEGLLHHHKIDRDNDVKIYVALLNEEVIGYYAIRAASRRIQSIELKKNKVRPIESSVIFIHGFAVKFDKWNKGIGKSLMNHCFGVTVQIANLVGVDALCLEAIDEKSVKFYET